MARATFRGIVTDTTTAAMLAEAARLVGDDIYLTMLQGSYSTSTAASSGTHAGGGVVDVDARGLTSEQQRRIETTLRRVGCAAWYRAPRSGVWVAHVHAIRQDCTDLASAARTQVGDYRAGYSGLPIGGRTNRDTGTRAYVDVTWASYLATQEDFDMSAAQEVKDYIAALLVYGYDSGGKRHPSIAQQLATNAGKLAALSTAVEQLAAKTGQPLDLVAIEDAAQRGASEALATLTATVTVTPGSPDPAA